MKSLPLYTALIAAVSLACSLAPVSVPAQAPYPSRTIKLIVPNPPGALPDTIARIIGRQLQDRLGQSVVIENKPGASAGLGTAALTSSPADGHTFLVTDGAILSINPLLIAKLPYDPKDVLPVALVARAPLFLATNTNLPITSMRELVDYAKANPGKLNYGSIGTGSFHHLTMEAMNSALGLSMNHIPYKGSSETIGALLGGHIDVLFASYAALRSAVETKKVAMLASNAAQRSPDAPDVPTVADMVPGFDLAVFQGLFARTGTPPAIVQKIAGEMMEIMKDPEVIRQYKVAGIEPATGGPDELTRALESEADRIAKVVQAANLKAH
jgi:tripartite-type tricarboxylate transporter receptor subunit TctC